MRDGSVLSNRGDVKMSDRETGTKKTVLRWMLPLAGVISLASIGLVLTGLRTPRIAVTSSGVTIENTWFDRTVPLSDIRVADVQVIDPDRTPELSTKWRTFGFGLPGHQSGWYRLQNGETALVFLTGDRRTVYIPTSKGYSLLVTPDDPDAFAAALRRG
jgi:hypothetical protein